MSVSANESGRRPNWVVRHELPIFFALTFVLSWLFWPFMLLNPDSSPLVPFGPLLAAVAVAALAGGRRQVLELLRQLTHWRVHAIWYVIALGTPLVLIGLAGAITITAGAPAPGPEAFADWAALPFTLLSTMVIVGLFEEVGWRGFALPRLQRTHSALWSALVIGGIWVAWHLPELVSDPTGQRPALPFLVALLGQSVILAWLYNSTGGSLPIVIIFHAGFNTYGRYLLPEFIGEYYLTMSWSIAIMYVIAAAAVTLHAGAERLTTHAEPRWHSLAQARHQL
jgi:hypothetical protein